MRRQAVRPDGCGRWRPHAESSTEGLPPGPAMAPIAQVLRWARDPIRFMEECATFYGDTFTIRLAADSPIVLTSDPDAIRVVLGTHRDNACAGEANAALQPLVGPNSLLLLDGARHAQHRAIMMPEFHGPALVRYGNVIRSIVRGRIGNWPVGHRFAIYSEMQSVTLDVMLGATIGADRAGIGSRLRELLLRLLKFAGTPLVRACVGHPKAASLRLTLYRMRRQIDELLSREIAERRVASGRGGEDILGLLLAARQESGEALSEAEVRDQLVTLLVAGHETTATSLAWLFHRVLCDQRVMHEVRDELRVSKQRAGGALPLVRFPYLEATINETLRLHPVFAVVGRRLRRPMRLGRFELHSGSVAAPCIYLAHRRADLWTEPEKFCPERFLGRSASPHHFLPFGGGARRCLGMAFALYEMRLIASEILSCVDLVAAGGVARTVRRNVTLAPADGVPVIVRSRLVS